MTVVVMIELFSQNVVPESEVAAAVLREQRHLSPSSKKDSGKPPSKGKGKGNSGGGSGSGSGNSSKPHQQQNTNTQQQLKTPVVTPVTKAEAPSTTSAGVPATPDLTQFW